MNRYCLIGHPVAHSPSAVFQNAAFQALGIDAEYEICDVEADNLDAFVKSFKKEYAGANVTIPYKELIRSMLDRVEGDARHISAVNTIVNENGKLIGYNTDVEGARAALCEGSDAGFLKNKKVVVLGAGGAARAAAFACLRAGADVTILNRTVQKAQALAQDMERLRKSHTVDVFTVTKYAGLDSFNVEQCDVLINATSVGMRPDNAAAPIDLLANRSELSKKDFVVMDIVYNPLETKLISDARSIGCKVITGERMLLHQGALSFELWTGQKAPFTVMEGALYDALQS